MESKSKIYFSIIIPVYNEIKNIQSTVDGIERAFNEVNKEYEIYLLMTIAKTELITKLLEYKN